MTDIKKIIVIGGGFAGLHLVRILDVKLFDILLIDRINHHQFQPLFYQVATSQIEPSSISFPLRNIFRLQTFENIISANEDEKEGLLNLVIVGAGPTGVEFYLEEMGVILLTETMVKDYDDISVQLTNGTIIKTKTVIWAAGVTGNMIQGLPKGSLTSENCNSTPRGSICFLSQPICQPGKKVVT